MSFRGRPRNFIKLFGDLLVFVYHCFDRIVIHGYLSGLSRPEQVAHFLRCIVGVPVVTKEVLSQRTADYQKWVEAFARNHRIPIKWAERGVRRYVQSWLRRMVRKNAYGVLVTGAKLVAVDSVIAGLVPAISPMRAKCPFAGPGQAP